MIGIPFAGGQPREGVREGPRVLREAGVVERIESLGWGVVDEGNLVLPDIRDCPGDEVIDSVQNPLKVGQACEAAAAATAKHAAAGRFVLSLGGDHSIAAGTIAGMVRQYPNLGVLWVDAHADINTPSSSSSGNMHGMPVSLLMGLNESKVPGFEWLDADARAMHARADGRDSVPLYSGDGRGVLPRSSVVYVGLRDLDPMEQAFLARTRIHSFDMSDIDRMGIHAVMVAAQKVLGNCPVHVSFDIDALDPREAPSTGTPVRGGLSYREANYICEYMHATRQQVSMDVVEINPHLSSPADVATTTDAGISLIQSTLGSTILDKQSIVNPHGARDRN
jgi:arginase